MVWRVYLVFWVVSLAGVAQHAFVLLLHLHQSPLADLFFSLIVSELSWSHIFAEDGWLIYQAEFICFSVLFPCSTVLYFSYYIQCSNLTFRLPRGRSTTLSKAKHTYTCTTMRDNLKARLKKKKKKNYYKRSYCATLEVTDNYCKLYVILLLLRLPWAFWTQELCRYIVYFGTFHKATPPCHVPGLQNARRVRTMFCKMCCFLNVKNHVVQQLVCNQGCQLARSAQQK